MPTVNELLGLGATKPETESERLAVRAIPEGVPTGLLTGAAAGALFGGPIGAGVGLLAGYLTNRERNAIIENVREDNRTTGEFANGLVERLVKSKPYADKYGSAHDAEQLDDIASATNRLRELALNPDPNVKSQAIAKLLEQDARLEAWRQEIETRTQFMADRDFEIRKEARGRYQNLIDYEATAISESQVQGEALLGQMQKLGAANPAVQARARTFFASTLSDYQIDNVQGGINVMGILNLAAGTIDHKFTEDEIYEGVTGILQTNRDTRGQRIAQLSEQASSEGFEISNRDGKISVEDIDATIPQFRELRRSDYPPTPSPKSTSRPSEIPEFLRRPDTPVEAPARMMPNQGAIDPMAWIAEQTLRRQQRRTN